MALSQVTQNKRQHFFTIEERGSFRLSVGLYIFNTLPVATVWPEVTVMIYMPFSQLNMRFIVD